MSKLTTDVLLKESIKAILTELVNSTYDWQEYTDSEISDILEISNEQALELSKIINDNVKANNKLWSSNKIDSELQNVVIEANKYSDELIGQISSISLEYVTALPNTDIKSNVIYILQGTPNTLNVYNSSTSAFVTVGDLNIDLTDYYTKSEVDAELAKKANADEVLSADAIVADLTTTSGSTTLSTAGLQTELDGVVKKTDIVTTIDNSSTDDKIPTAKAIYNKSKNKILHLSNGTDILAYADSITREDVSITIKLKDGINCPYGADVIYNDFYYTIYNMHDDKFKRIVAYNIRRNEMYMIMKYNDAWGTWKRVCTTSVADAGLTYISTFEDETYVKPTGTNTCSYHVINGHCIVTLQTFCLSTTQNFVQIASGLPKPKTFLYANAIDRNVTTNSGARGVFQITSSGAINVVCNYGDTSVTAGRNLYVTFSYPIAE